MKKTILIILSIALLLSLAGCRSMTPIGSSSIFSSQSSVSLTSSKAQSAASSVDPSAMTATNGTPENHITYIYYSIPISYMKQNVQILSGDGGWYNDVNEIVKNAPSADNLKKYYIADMYSDVANIPTIDEYPELTDGFICSNGNWDFFPNKVRYEEYTFGNQPNKPEWDKYFMSRIKEKTDETPLIYVNAWFFDWNRDGIEDAFVNASNTLYSKEDNTPNPPSSDKTVTYTISVLFLSGNEPFETSGYISNYISKKPLEKDDDGIVSYNQSKKILGEHFISAIQYDSKRYLIICPIFNSGEYGRYEEDEMILCDIDGDGKSEFITTSLSEYSPYIVYKLFNGKPIEVFRITRPA